MSDLIHLDASTNCDFHVVYEIRHESLPSDQDAKRNVDLVTWRSVKIPREAICSPASYLVGLTQNLEIALSLRVGAAGVTHHLGYRVEALFSTVKLKRDGQRSRAVGLERESLF